MFRALSLETRAEIVRLISGGPLCVGAISSRLGITQGAVSQHLRILRDAGIVEDERCGQFVHYGLVPDVKETLIKLINGIFEPVVICARNGNCRKGESKKCVAKKTSAKNRKY